jgi:cold shock protein
MPFSRIEKDFMTLASLAKSIVAATAGLLAGGSRTGTALFAKLIAAHNAGCHTQKSSAVLASRCMIECYSFIRSSGMATGTVKWFNSQKGYGFIAPQAGGKDVFVHISAVERAGLSGLNEGQVVEYEEVANKGKTSAENLKVHR